MAKSQSHFSGNQQEAVKQLLEVLNESEKQAAEGQVVAGEEVIAYVKARKKKSGKIVNPKSNQS